MELNMLGIEQRDNVEIVRLHRGVTNPINLALVRELAGVLKEAKGESSVRSIVIGSGNEKFFSIGFDLPALLELDREGFSVFYEEFNQLALDLYTFPKPTVAAITGHATAGGCILALCCDYRVISEGKKLMGLNEVKLGVPIPYIADCALRDLVGVRHSREIVEMGEFYPPEQSLEMGLVDQVAPLDRVWEKATERAAKLGALPPNAFAKIKKDRVERIADQVLQKEEEKSELFYELWFSDDARRALKKALEAFRHTRKGDGNGS